jgi:hypothetical protein
VDEAAIAAITALSQCMSKDGEAPRLPRDSRDIKSDEVWLTRNHVDLSQAIITMISAPLDRPNPCGMSSLESFEVDVVLF